MTGAVPSAIGGAAPLRWFGAGDWFWGCIGTSGLTFDSDIGWAILPRYWGSSASSGPLRSGLYELPMGESVGEETENSDSDSDSESVDSVDELLWSVRSGVASRGGLSQSALVRVSFDDVDIVRSSSKGGFIETVRLWGRG